MIWDKPQCLPTHTHAHGHVSLVLPFLGMMNVPHQRRMAPTVSCYVPPPPDYLTDIHGPRHDDLIKPRKLLNPVKSSRSHQELHRELMTSCKRNKPELERVLECRRRDQLIKERKKQEEARRKISPLEAELRKRHQALEEMELEQQKDERDKLAAPEFVKVKENLRRTSYAGKEEKQKRSYGGGC
uniref:Actin-associated protein FAM107A n=1 Tax=Hippocampus comes TaxID=109280 RepID=A0A3Q2Y3R8_HIPCM